LGILSKPVATNTVIAASVAIDLAGFTAGTVGVKLAGSGVYQVVHASVVVFAALFAWVLRGRMISRAQWGAILLITVGLAISAMGSGSSGQSDAHGALEQPTVPDPDTLAAGGDAGSAAPALAPPSSPAGRRLSGAMGSDEGGAPSDATSIASGIVFTLIGAILYGLNYSLLDALSSTPTAPAQSRLAGAIGSWAAAAVSLWVLGVTIPSWDELLRDPTHKAGGSPFVLLLGFGMIGLSALAHSLAYFRLLKGHGAVMIGVLQALRAALVFLAGSVLFCGYQESQCLTAPRGIAATLVAIGVMAFAGSKRRTTTSPQSAH
jgi:drug/metabolite transporter (DMT)-like permease